MAIIMYRTKEMGALGAVYKAAQSCLEAARKEFRSASIGDSFSKKLQELQKARDDWQALGNERQRRYSQLLANRQQLQLQQHLEKWRIQQVSIKGIGPGKKAMLRSYNIETAWDVTETNIIRVPGFGPKNTATLLAWRNNAERVFKFDPTKGVDGQAIAALDRDIGTRRQKLQQVLINGDKELTQISRQSEMWGKAVRTRLEEAYRNMLQARADVRAA